MKKFYNIRARFLVRICIEKLSKFPFDIMKINNWLDLVNVCSIYILYRKLLSILQESCFIMK